jgi:hypothetical protein
MTINPQARSQSMRPDPSGASRTGGAPLRRYAGASLPNDKVSCEQGGATFFVFWEAWGGTHFKMR